VINHRGAQVTTINPHIMKLVAIEQIADLRRGAAPRPETTATPRQPRRVKRAHQPRQAPAVAPVQDR
jgi:hypothetical protein